MKLRLALACLAVPALLTGAAHSQILKLAELNSTQVQELGRTHTVVLIPNGIMEEHGPYLPSFTDGYLDQAIAT